MKLKNLFLKLKDNKLQSLKLKGLSYDSRRVAEGDLFFIIKRKNFDIFSVLSLVEKKAAAFVGEFKDKKKISSLIKQKPLILVKDIEKELYRVSNIFYQINTKALKFIGITGTNGKTTVAFLVYHILSTLKQKPSLIGTLKYIIGSKQEKSDYTTPDFLKLRKILERIKGAGSKFAVIEVSSHALDQDRTKGISFQRCLFTNLSRDHLDYHKTFEKYFKAKEKLFLNNPQAVSLINSDDPYGRRLLTKLKNGFSYGIDNSPDFKAANIILNHQGCSFDVIHSGKSYPIRSRLWGKHNVSNILGAVSLVLSLGFPADKIIKAVSSFKGPEGRLEAIKRNIFVDYAHTPEALRRALESLNQIGYKKIICLFGCGGQRDKGKRKLMGKVASSLADFTFITSDNPRQEDRQKICRQIAQGFKEENYSIILDRKKAIKKAVNTLKKQNQACLLVAGKGHEDCQIIGDKKIPFKDGQVIRKIIKNM
jgi:UDP-N-acetylmuramoyl-L-alanyl-D-glutamate--2,6-diaminopimelate ligase